MATWDIVRQQELNIEIYISCLLNEASLTVGTLELACAPTIDGHMAVDGNVKHGRTEPRGFPDEAHLAGGRLESTVEELLSASCVVCIGKRSKLRIRPDCTIDAQLVVGIHSKLVSCVSWPPRQLVFVLARSHHLMQRAGQASEPVHLRRSFNSLATHLLQYMRHSWSLLLYEKSSSGYSPVEFVWPCSWRSR